MENAEEFINNISQAITDALYAHGGGLSIRKGDTGCSNGRLGGQESNEFGVPRFPNVLLLPPSSPAWMQASIICCLVTKHELKVNCLLTLFLE